MNFRYVQLKVKKISNMVQDGSLIGLNKKSSNKKKANTLIQIIDVSHKLLYGEAKAEQSFLSLINGAVSHELRNPLNSLIG